MKKKGQTVEEYLKKQEISDYKHTQEAKEIEQKFASLVNQGKKEQAMKMLEEFAKNHGYSTQFFSSEFLTEEICWFLLRLNPRLFYHIKEHQTEEMAKYAVKHEVTNLHYVKELTEEICEIAIQTNPKEALYRLKYKGQTEELCLKAVQLDGMALDWVKKQTPEICLAAVSQNPKALVYVRRQSLRICLEAVARDGMMLEYVKRQTRKICEVAVKQNPLALKYAEYQTIELAMEAYVKNPEVQKYFNF